MGAEPPDPGWITIYRFVILPTSAFPLATAFGVIANEGKRIDLNPLLEIKDYKGNIFETYDLKNNPPAGERVISPAVTYLISHILLDNNARAAMFGTNSQLIIGGHAVSVKTGTTDDLRDNWTIGFNPSFLTAVWVGNNDNSPMNPYLVSGITGAAPIWNKIMNNVLKDEPDEWPKQPQDVVGRQVCTFMTVNPDENKGDCQARFEYFINNTQPHQKIERKKIMIDKDTGWPPEADKTDNLEEQEHTVATDPFVKDYCLDCPEDKRKPLMIDMAKFKEQQNSPKPTN